MRVYEVLFIVAPNIEESDIDTLVTQLSDVATNQGARIAKIDRMGRRRLAYPIGKFNDGHYVVFTVEGSGAEIAETRTAHARHRRRHQVHNDPHRRGLETRGEVSRPSRGARCRSAGSRRGGRRAEPVLPIGDEEEGEEEEAEV